MVKLSFLFLVSIFSMQAFAQLNRNLAPYPCKRTEAKPQIDLKNSDDLFMAGRFLVRNYRVLEGVQCLNIAKDIAPAYLDVRLELLYAFVELGDKSSALSEARELGYFALNDYYYQTYRTYTRKISNISVVSKPKAGFSFMPKVVVDDGTEYKVLTGEDIVNEDVLKKIVILKHQSFFTKARKMMDEEVLPYNRESPTVYMYSGLLYYNLNQPKLGESHLKKALEVAYNDPDVILSISRALNAQSKYNESYSLLKTNISYFNDYGCFQLGSSLKDVLVNLNSSRTGALDKILMDSLYNGTVDTRLCRRIENFLK